VTSKGSSVQAVLSQFSSVPGVIGSMVCDVEGQMLAQVFPPTFEAARLQQAASTLAERAAALQGALGSVGMIDLRYANARIVVKAVEGGRLLFLCAPSLNLELLNLTAAGAMRGIEALTARRPGSPPAPAAGGQLYATVQRINALIESGPGDAFKLRGQIALKAGFALDLVEPNTPDDPTMLQKLKAAASAVLGQPV